jgi:hypothetical protein
MRGALVVLFKSESYDQIQSKSGNHDLPSGLRVGIKAGSGSDTANEETFITGLFHTLTLCCSYGLLFYPCTGRHMPVQNVGPLGKKL